MTHNFTGWKKEFRTLFVEKNRTLSKFCFFSHLCRILKIKWRLRRSVGCFAHYTSKLSLYLTHGHPPISDRRANRVRKKRRGKKAKRWDTSRELRILHGPQITKRLLLNLMGGTVGRRMYQTSQLRLHIIHKLVLKHTTTRPEMPR